MRSFDKKRSSRDNSNWDDEIVYLVPEVKGSRYRLVGPVQDLAFHWVFLGAGKFADKVAKKKRLARRKGKAFKRPRDPRGFPVLCPKYDPWRETFVDYVNPKTGETYRAKEVLTLGQLKQYGVKTTKKMRRMKGLRFAPESVEGGKAIPLKPIACAMHDDFNTMAQTRTFWHAIDRRAQKKRGNRDCIGIVGKLGMPWTPYNAIERIANTEQMNPADAKHGFDLMFSLDPSLRGSDMWAVDTIRKGGDSPLTKEERRMLFGRYKLADGTKTDFRGVVRLRLEDPDRLEGMKVVEKAALWPLDEIAARGISNEDLRESMGQQGYYDRDGSPRQELIKSDDDEWKSDDDDEEFDELDEDEEEETGRRGRKKRKRKKRKKRKRKKRKRRKAMLDDDI